MKSRNAINAIFMAVLLLTGTCAAAEGIGKIKTLSGDVTIERDGKTMAPALGNPVFQKDKIVTGKNGSVGLLFDDDSRLSAGPNSTLDLEKFSYDPATHDGSFDVSMKKGVLSVISGKLTQKTPGALKVKTPAAILAVRGTEFSVKVEDPSEEKAAQ
ncbi:polyketide cyclase/dehydrase [Novimethylophilus kurashikiensis]|uniref:Polyketide cyclase/dehydrase n=1 Tax=Novimethylophilus kurashikiensis TaxID=1825523 RepID=A0A2R5F3S6_9PROT|nr:FecR domain-containing protein [Novimethylophilus kurashikiensis]GBG12935.1 polyketide cyclase/dehydrase [Novimethylophilus kurashikiensis]